MNEGIHLIERTESHGTILCMAAVRAVNKHRNNFMLPHLALLARSFVCSIQKY